MIAIARVLLFSTLLALLGTAYGAEDGDGAVTLPLPDYTRLVDASRQDPRAAPAPYAIGISRLAVELIEREEHVSAQVVVALEVRVLESKWTLVPLLPAGTALADARVGGAPVQLVQGPEGLSLGVERAGVMAVTLRYGVDAMRSDSGFVLPLPVPRAAATSLELGYAGSGLDLAIVPGTDVRREVRDGRTVVMASIPSTTAVMVTWRRSSDRPFSMSRAHYEGRLADEALALRATFVVDVLEGGEVILPLMPSSVTLGELMVDGAPATVLEREGRFATVLSGRGRHEVVVEFEVPVLASDGPPAAQIRIPRVPVSRFELVLPGRKEVQVEPRARVVAETTEDETRVAVNVPMSDRVTFSWVDAIPETLRAKARAVATLYHTARAEEGVLHARALVVYEVSRGATGQLELALPAAVQVNRVSAEGAGISDWTEGEGEGDEKRLSVFFERPVEGRVLLDVVYERLLAPGEGAGQPIAVPLLSAEDVQRQRGMVALLAGDELTLEPVTESAVTRVGENQLPAFVRERIAGAVAHTYKYTARTPSVTVRAAAPKRVAGKFDAQVDTLISIGEVAMKGAATVTVNVKSGAIMALALRLPEDVNVLGVTGPSIRGHEVRPGDDATQTVDIAFTQDMEGQFRVDVAYERILVDGPGAADVPAVAVTGAEVEHGRIAVEALAAVEVRAAATEQLSSIDLAELPRQLVLKTTNPILLAFKYVHAEPPQRLALQIVRHREIDVQVAAIESAQYSTLLTRDGLAITTARYQVRNSRRQFLRLDLPPGSEIWSVFTNGKAEKPAYPSGDEADGAALIKMINSTEGFPVEIVYATRLEPMRFIGEVVTRLPRPDMVVTRTLWELYLPVGPSYRTPETNLDVHPTSGHVVRGQGRGALAGPPDEKRAPLGEPLRIVVPREGMHIVLAKLYADQSPEDAAVRIGYTSVDGARLGLVATLVGAVLAWLGIVALARRGLPVRNRALAAIGAGAGAVAIGVGYLGASPTPAATLTLAVAAVMAIWVVAGRVRRSFRRRMERRAGPGPTD